MRILSFLCAAVLSTAAALALTGGEAGASAPGTFVVQEKAGQPIHPLLFNGGYSWWCYPNIVSQSGVTYLSYVRGGNTYIASDSGTSEGRVEFLLQTSDRNDEHNTAAICIAPDGGIVTAFARHNDEKAIHVRRSLASGDIRAFEEPVTLPASDVVTYAQLLYSGGVFYLFYRCGITSWALRTSEDACIWGPERIFLVFTGQSYIRTVPCGGDHIRIFAIGNPINSSEHDIRMVTLSTKTSRFETFDGEPVARLDGDGLPLQSTALPAVFSQTAGKRTRLFDVNASPGVPANITVAHATFLDASDCLYQVTSGSPEEGFRTATVCEGGLPLETTEGVNSYFAGMWFEWEDDKTVYVARESGGEWLLEEYATGDFSAWELRRVIDRGPMKLYRPCVPFGGGALVWQKGFYANSEEYDTRIINSSLLYRDLKEDGGLDTLIRGLHLDKTVAEPGDPVTANWTPIPESGCTLSASVVYLDHKGRWIGSEEVGLEEESATFHPDRGTAGYFRLEACREPGIYCGYFLERFDLLLEPLTLLGVTASEEHVAVGDAVTFSAVATGGERPLKYHYCLFKNEEEYERMGWQKDASKAVALPQSGLWRMQALVEDGAGSRSEYALSLPVSVGTWDGGPTLVGVGVSKLRVGTGEAVTFRPLVHGGMKPYRYHYRLFLDGEEYKSVGWLEEDVRTSILHPPGVWRMEVLVVDAGDKPSEYVLSPGVTVSATGG